MKMKLIIGYDGSPCANAAIDGLSRAGLPADAEAVVLTAADVEAEVPFTAYHASAEMTAPGPSPAVVLEVCRRAAGTASESHKIALVGARRVRALFPGWAVTADAVDGSPWRAIVARAEAWQANLLVLGSHGRSALGRFVLGSVSQQVLAHAPCSVRIGRAARETAGPVRIMLGVDESEDATAAVSAVAARSWPAGTEVRAITAMDPKLATLAWSILRSAEDGGVVASIQRRAGAAARELSEAGLNAVPLVLEGNPARVLVEEAEMWGADCIVLGAQGHGKLGRLLVGSVSAAVAARARCSVEVVRDQDSASASE